MVILQVRERKLNFSDRGHTIPTTAEISKKGGKFMTVRTENAGELRSDDLRAGCQTEKQVNRLVLVAANS